MKILAGAEPEKKPNYREQVRIFASFLISFASSEDADADSDNTGSERDEQTRIKSCVNE